MANRLVGMVAAQAARYGKREAYRFCWRKEGEWISTSWDEFALQVEVAARAIASLGLLEKDTLAICSPNTPQILITELGAFKNRMACIPLYSSSSQEQFDFIVTNGEASLLFVGDAAQYSLAYNYWKKHPDSIRCIVVFRNEGLELHPDDTVTISWDDFIRLGVEAGDDIIEEVKARAERGLPEDTATLIYTSGTTGEPKGVCLTHANYDAAMGTHLALLNTVSDKDVSMAFLPMSHIFEKAWCFFCLTKGIAIAVNYDPRSIQKTIREVKPNIMCCVPRFWEKVYAAVKEKIASMSWVERKMVTRAIRVGYLYNLDYRRLGKKAPALLEKEYNFWNKKVFMRLKHAIGIPDPNIFPTAGAPLSDRITTFLQSVGIDVVIGYGLSETTATVSCFQTPGFEIGTVGRPLPGISVRISEEGEILVKGPTVTPGYYRNPEANAQAFTDDGYFRTGDAGYLTPEGAIVLTERIKDLFKTSNGKYIAPQMLESRLAENKYIDEVAVIGDRRKYVTALVVPNMEQLQAWAGEQGIPVDNTKELLKDKRVCDFMMEQIDEVQSDLASYEQIKRITLLPRHFSLEKGEVTNTMKVRRNVVAKNFAKVIDRMYEKS
ncbi:MAG: long-chain fatty acid--CoA ligase [Muribaculaceae bacterium]|nr:long-chain fatty acid--CoA ligase [Muribaculaceae bacterium]